MSKQNQTLTLNKMPARGAAKPPMSRLHNQLLIRLGLRSKCCGAKIITWHHDKFYCDDCNGWLNRIAR